MINPDDLNTNDYFIHPDFETLYEENRLLRRELAVLMEEHEHINRVVIPSTQIKFLIKVGALHVEISRRQISVMKLRRRIALARENMERGEAIYESVINGKLEREFKELDERLQGDAAQISAAKSRFSQLCAHEDSEEIRNVYRLLLIRMSPDINPDQGEEAGAFWGSIQSAYEWNDLFHLKALLMMADDYPESYDLPTDIGGVRRNQEILKEKIMIMTAKLEKSKQHPAFEWKKLLDDPIALNAEQTKLRNEIERIQAQEYALQELLFSLDIRELGGINNK